MTTQSKNTYWNPYFAGVLLGGVLLASYLASGHGVGAAGAITRLVVAVEDVVAPTHVDQTPAIAAFAGGERKPLEHWLPWEMIGILLGGFVSGLLRKRVKLETFRGTGVSDRSRWMLALAGGVVMGYGARLARGCTSGQGLSGGVMLAVGSWVFLGAVFAGGYALAYFFRRQWQEG